MLITFPPERKGKPFKNSSFCTLSIHCENYMLSKSGEEGGGRGRESQREGEENTFLMFEFS